MSGRTTGRFLSKSVSTVVRELVAPRALGARRLSTTPIPDLGFQTFENSLVVRTSDRCAGCARIADTHVAVWVLVEARRQGLSDDEILCEHPILDKTSLQAAWDFAQSHPDEIQQDTATGSKNLAELCKESSTAQVTIGEAGRGLSIKEQGQALAADLTSYKGKWIALIDGQVVDADPSHNNLEQRLRDKGLLHGALFAKL